MPRQNPISNREIEICERLRQARHATHLSQVAFAKLLDIDSSRLASHEHARVPIRFEFAVRAAALARVSLPWLAEGGNTRDVLISIDPKLRERIQKNQLFSRVYDEWLKPAFDAKLKNINALTGGKLDSKSLSKFADDPAGSFIGNIGPDDILKVLSSHLKNIIWSIPPHLYQELYSDIETAATHFHRRKADEIRAFPVNKLPKFDLTDSETVGNLAEVKAQLPNLLERLNRATSESGKMSELAEFLGVPLASISRWLSGKREPGGEITLKLLRWVERQERQK